MRQTHNKAFNDLFKRNRHAWIRAETELVSVGSKGTGFLVTDIVAVCMLAFCHLNLCQAYGTDHLYAGDKVIHFIITFRDHGGVSHYAVCENRKG